MKNYTWERNKDAELWQNDSFETIEECIKDAIENYEYKKGDIIYVGETQPFTVQIDAISILEELEEQAFEFAGEAAEGWSTNESGKDDEVEELSNELTKVVKAWLKKYDREPNFYLVENIVPVEII